MYKSKIIAKMTKSAFVSKKFATMIMTRECIMCVPHCMMFTFCGLLVAHGIIAWICLANEK